MTDLEMTTLCAEAMGYKVYYAYGPRAMTSERYSFAPLLDDSDAMELVKKLELWIQPPRQGHLLSAPSDQWFVAHSARGGDSKNTDLNRAIVECVAKMQKALHPA